MNQHLTVLEAIDNFLFGKKYYAIAVYRTGDTEIFLTGEIFRTKREAEARKKVIVNETISFKYVTTVTFRSKKID